MSLADHRTKILVRGGTFGRYLPSGHLVYVNRGTLFAVPFDADRLEVHGTPAPVLDQIGYNVANGSAQFDFSQTGTLIYRSGGAAGGGLFIVAWLDGAGKTQPLLAKPGNYGLPSMSPDGQRLALDVTDGSGTDIWLYDWQRDTMTRLTFTGNAAVPVWSPDGRYIAFRAAGEGMSVTRSDGAGKPQPLTQSKNGQTPWSFTPDGKRVAFMNKALGAHVIYGPCRWRAIARGCVPGSRRFSCKRWRTSEPLPFPPTGGGWPILQASRGPSKFTFAPFRTREANGKSRTAAARTRCGRATDTSFSSRLWITTSWWRLYAVKGDSFVDDKPRVWSEKQLMGLGIFNQAKNVDLAPDGKRIIALMPVETAEAQKAQNQVIFLENFFDEVRRLTAPQAK